MNNLNKNFIDDDGRNGTMIASSDDDYEVKLDNYTISNHKAKRQSALARKFKIIYSLYSNKTNSSICLCLVFLRNFLKSSK